MSSKNHNIYQTYSDPLTKQPQIIYRDWSTWLAKYFKKIPSITHYHHFKMSHQNKGILILKESIDSSENIFSLLKKGLDKNGESLFTDQPEELFPLGLSVERQWYLYDQIRMHIADEKDKEATCPEPKMNRLLIKNLMKIALINLYISIFDIHQ